MVLGEEPLGYLPLAVFSGDSPIVIGGAVLQMTSMSISSTAAAAVKAALAEVIQGLSLDATSDVLVRAVLAESLTYVPVVSSGLLVVSGVLDQPVGDVTIFATDDTVLGVTDVLMGPMSLAGVGKLAVVGSATVGLTDLDVLASGGLIVEGGLDHVVTDLLIEAGSTTGVSGELSGSVSPAGIFSMGRTVRSIVMFIGRVLTRAYDA